MKKPVATPHDSVKRALAIWPLLLRDYHPRDFAIRFWDASRWPAEPAFGYAAGISRRARPISAFG